MINDLNCCHLCNSYLNKGDTIYYCNNCLTNSGKSLFYIYSQSFYLGIKIMNKYNMYIFKKDKSFIILDIDNPSYEKKFIQNGEINFSPNIAENLKTFFERILKLQSFA